MSERLETLQQPAERAEQLRCIGRPTGREPKGARENRLDAIEVVGMLEGRKCVIDKSLERGDRHDPPGRVEARDVHAVERGAGYIASSSFKRRERRVHA